MTEEISDVLETIQKLQGLYKKFTEYLNESKKNPSDTSLEVKTLNFTVGKKEKEYTVNMECDFSLSPKTEANTMKNNEKEPA